MHRRDFFRMASLGAAALTLPHGLVKIVQATPQAQKYTNDPRVVSVRDGNAHNGSQVNGSIAQLLLDEAMRRYTGIADVGSAYLSRFPNLTTSHVIGIKVNCINSDCPTHPAVAYAIANGLQRMSINGAPFPANNVIIWDRTSAELQSAGYTINSGATGVRCFGTDLVGYAATNLNVNGSFQHPSNLIVNFCDYLVNVSVLKNGSGCGVTLGMKNLYGAIDNPSALHDNYCNPYIPALNQQIRGVLAIQESLFIVDAIFGIYYGGPQGPPNMIYDGIILGGDRVATDAVGRQILADQGCPTIGVSRYIDMSAQPPYNLGTANLSAIELLEVDNPSSAVRNLSINRDGGDVVLNWSTPEYSGAFQVQRSVDPNFSSVMQLATISANNFRDAGALATGERFFYRIVKTW